MEKALSKKDLIAHIEWSLDDVFESIEAVNEHFREDLHVDEGTIKDNSVFVKNVHFKEISPEGYISNWYRKNPLKKGYYILVIETYFSKDLRSDSHTYYKEGKLYSL